MPTSSIFFFGISNGQSLRMTIGVPLKNNLHPDKEIIMLTASRVFLFEFVP